eukprot:CAMPEP_0180628866 /NCGR_PEP_ID=MMETSP1037_2-20121125/39159_1 /TAXON_ID=632150 /ORGANISM="Azadinium spinosum, Strain 3D9" /LENGTH=43 /DNA_ID= /DNA_START= /DNA_END= /DNA_ORIENTATION=
MAVHAVWRRLWQLRGGEVAKLGLQEVAEGLAEDLQAPEARPQL